jgi:hypothetical protein
MVLTSLYKTSRAVLSSDPSNLLFNKIVSTFEAKTLDIIAHATNVLCGKMTINPAEGCDGGSYRRVQRYNLQKIESENGQPIYPILFFCRVNLPLVILIMTGRKIV